jgi:hypothetical protein
VEIANLQVKLLRQLRDVDDDLDWKNFQALKKPAQKSV